jgi:two-component sensor histidine kinase/putative methionine-R-sulfoxide reductase with GAF domain
MANEDGNTVPNSIANSDRLRRYQQILADFSRMVAESTDIPSLLQLAVVQAARGIGIKHSKVMQYRSGKGDLLVVAGVGWLPGVVGQTTFGADVESAPGLTLQTRQALVVYDVVAEPGLRNPPTLRQHGIVSLLNVPVAVDGIVWGVLEVDSDTPRHFGSDDVSFLLTIANTLGLALQSRIAIQQTAEEAAAAAANVASHKVLLRELEHRFKNDFQLIQGLLAMQLRKQRGEDLRRDIRHLMDRIAAIGLAHDQLSPSGAHGVIDLFDYLQALCGSFNQRREGVQVKSVVARVKLPHERAIPLGLVVNELVTNALKHAYPADISGVIRVTFDRTPMGEGVLCVSDDGVGMGPPRKGSSGTDLVTRLVRQIGGQVEQMEQVRGSGFCIRFPMAN